MTSVALTSRSSQADRPVVDQSRREGRFNIATGALRRLDTASPSAVPDALKTLGLSLRPQRAPLDVLVIDSIDRMPTDN